MQNNDFTKLRKRQHGCNDPSCDQDREGKMQWAGDRAFCDPCIAPMVAALNAAGIVKQIHNFD